MDTRWLLLLAMVPAVGLLGTSVVQEPAPVLAPFDQEQRPGVRPASTPTKALVAFKRWVPGDRRTYEYTWSSLSEGDLRNGAAIDGKAKLRLTCVGQKGRDVLLRVELSDLRLKGYVAGPNPDVRAAEMASLVEGLRATYSHPFLLAVSGTGQVKSVHSSRALDQPIHGPYDAIAALLQFVRPNAGALTAPHWESRELDALGSYLARYEAVLEDGSAVFQKRKTGYVTTVLPDVSVERIKVENEARYAYGHDGVLKRASLRETVLCPVDESWAGGRGEHVLELLEQDHVETASADLSAFRNHTFGDPYVRKLTRQDRELRLAKRIEGKTFDSIYGDLLAAADGDAYGDWTEQQDDMAALFLLRPETIDRALAELADLDEAAANALIAALEVAATPESQRALLDIASDESANPQHRRHAILRAGQTQFPTQDTVEELRSLAKSEDNPQLRNLSTYMLGASVRRVRSGEDVNAMGSASAAFEDLVDALDSAEMSAKKRVLIDAIGNAGGDAALEPLRQQLAGDDPGLRATAAMGLRFVEGAEGVGLTATAIRDDPDAEVRKSALSSLSYREALEPGLLAAVNVSMTADEDPIVRGMAAEAGGFWLDSHPELEPVLRQVVDGDPDAFVRQRARHALGMPPEPDLNNDHLTSP